MELRNIRLCILCFIFIQIAPGCYNSYWISTYIFSPEQRPLGFIFGIISLVLTAGGWILLFTLIYGLVKLILIFIGHELKYINLSSGAMAFMLVVMAETICCQINTAVNLLPILKIQNFDSIYEINYFFNNLSASTWSTINNKIEYFFLFASSVTPPIILKIKKEPIDFLDIAAVSVTVAVSLMLVKATAVYLTAS